MMDTRDRLEEVGHNRDKHGLDFNDNKSLLGDYITAEELRACTTCNACGKNARSVSVRSASSWNCVATRSWNKVMHRKPGHRCSITWKITRHRGSSINGETELEGGVRMWEMRECENERMKEMRECEMRECENGNE